MPELPEVETIKRVLEPQIQGHTITSVIINRPEVIAYPSSDEFSRNLAGQTISSISRRGKFLIILLNNGGRITLHLRMTGWLLLLPADFPEEKHTHVIFKLDNGSDLRFSDTRRFGRFWIIQNNEADTCSGIEKLGKEPFDPSFNAQYLYHRLGKRKKAIKECMLEQSVVSGIGNIYSDEILFSAQIYPARPANSLTKKEWERLAETIPKQLSYFIEKNNITPEEYLKNKGQYYCNAPYLQVYGHEGKPCPICGETLCRKVIGGRSSIFCPHCQKDLPC